MGILEFLFLFYKKYKERFMLPEKYLLGQGVDTSKAHYIKKAIHKYIEPNNLYLLRNQIGIETKDYLFASEIINETKYFRILLYEWFLIVKKGGYLIIELKENEILNYTRLKEEIAALQLYKDKYKIIKEYHHNNKKSIILQKSKSIKIPDHLINHWTFGLVTNGKRKELITKALSSIRKLNIPHYEIIICGTYYGKTAPDINYIPFTKYDERGWITQKKNIICENARYENIVVIHDRIYFDQDWFEGMKRWGNYFDVLSCPIFLPSKKKIFINWETVGPDWKKDDDSKLFHSNAHLDPSDWDPHVYVGGAIIILKKSIWKLEKWNKNLFWGDAEDIEYSLRQHERGIMIRLNPYAKVFSSTFSGISFVKSFREKDSRKLGKHYGNFLIDPLLKTLDLLGFRRNQKAVVSTIKLLKKMNGATDWRMRR